MLKHWPPLTAELFSKSNRFLQRFMHCILGIELYNGKNILLLLAGLSLLVRWLRHVD